MAKSYREQATQISCISWIRRKYPTLVVLHVNNNAKSAREGARLKAMGLLAGVPDLFIAQGNPEHLGLWVELKDKGKKPTAAQLALHERLRNEGYAVAVCDSFEAFRIAVTLYLNAQEANGALSNMQESLESSSRPVLFENQPV